MFTYVNLFIVIHMLSFKGVSLLSCSMNFEFFSSKAYAKVGASMFDL